MWFLYVDKNHVFGLVNDIKEGRSGDLQCFVTYQIDDLLSHPEKYTAVRVCIYLQNNTEYDVEGLQVLSYREKVYIENGYLICDVPLLPAKFSDYSHDETWIILESKDFSENSLNDLDLYIKGCIYTESREKSTVNVEFKIYCDNVK